MKKAAFAIALGVGLVGFGLLQVYKQRFEAEMSGGAPIGVLMATRDVPVGEPLDEPMLGIRQLPEAYVEPRHIRAADLKDVLGTRTSLGLRAGQSVLWTDLSTMEVKGRDLSSLVQDGMRAVAVRADSFDGLLRPGDRVDVLFTPNGELDEAEQATVTLLQNLLVLAIGGRTNVEEGQAFRGDGVTLSATVDQARVLAHAAQRGRLTLALRHPDDIVITDSRGQISVRDVMEPERRTDLQRRAQRTERKIDHVQ